MKLNVQRGLTLRCTSEVMSKYLKIEAMNMNEISKKKSTESDKHEGKPAFQEWVEKLTHYRRLKIHRK